MAKGLRVNMGAFLKKVILNVNLNAQFLPAMDH
jgi:hypothetical protein